MISHSFTFKCPFDFLLKCFVLRTLGPLFMTLPTAPNPRDAHAHCMDFVAGNDDPHLGTCLNAVGIYPVNTMDYQLKNRFMVFRNSDHLIANTRSLINSMFKCDYNHVP
eukprot:499755_1